MDKLVVDSCTDIANLVIDSPFDNNLEVRFARSLQITLALEYIWFVAKSCGSQRGPSFDLITHKSSGTQIHSVYEDGLTRC